MAAVVVVFSALLAGCAGGPGAPDGFACPAIGWSNSLSVELEGGVSSVAEVQGCVEDVCSHFVRLPPKTDAPVEIITPAPGGGGGGETRRSHPPREFSPYMASRVDEDSWRVRFEMTSPASVTVRALDTDGAVLAEEDFALEWVRVGGSEQCGGPGEAGPVTLRIP